MISIPNVDKHCDVVYSVDWYTIAIKKLSTNKQTERLTNANDYNNLWPKINNWRRKLEGNGFNP